MTPVPKRILFARSAAAAMKISANELTEREQMYWSMVQATAALS
jgi:hypothetical protein